LLPLLVALSWGCYDFHLTGPEDAPELTPPGFVSVSVEYRQPNGCLNQTLPCNEPVVFFGSWMQKGAEFQLTRDPGTFVWRGIARQVPVNFPPRDDPYTVRIFDPYLRETCTAGFQAERIRFGGEALSKYEGGGCAGQAALAFVDDNGYGHNPY
jgi:hypothetical protein